MLTRGVLIHSDKTKGAPATKASAAAPKSHPRAKMQHYKSDEKDLFR
jgi:hypothetical protein